MRKDLNQYLEELKIDWINDTLGVIRAKMELAKFYVSRDESDGKYPKIDAYNSRRIEELETFINQ